MLIVLFGGRNDMKFLLICPSNMMYMPYVDNYEKILINRNINYDKLIWDRFNIESSLDINIYRDIKVGHKRNYYDYYKYKQFVVKTLSANKYDKVIVFSLQLAYFLHDYLIKNYNERFILDIRDYNKIVKFFNLKKLIDYSAFVVISSPGFIKWLPKNKEYIINHNTSFCDLSKLRKLEVNTEERCISIAYIGALRDYEININLINTLKNNDNYLIYYHGHGEICQDISCYLKKNNIHNVTVTGKYLREEEEKLYFDNNLINVLIPNNDINSKTLMPNRLYNAVISGKPVLSLEGNYVSEQVKKYCLGLVVSSFDNLDMKINEYMCNINQEKFETGQKLFFQEVINDNEHFKKRLLSFLLKKTV